MSLDEFALALFLAGTDVTFPVYLFGQLRYASRLPMMIAFAVLMMMGTLLLCLLPSGSGATGNRAKSGRPASRVSGSPHCPYRTEAAARRIGRPPASN